VDLYKVRLASLVHSRDFWGGTMNGTAARFLQIAASSAGLLVLGCVLTGHAARPVRQGIPLPTDWSHQHVIFTGQGYANVPSRVSDDPRYLQQFYRRTQSLRLPEEIAEGRMPSPASFAVRARNIKRRRGLWSEDLGSGGTIGAGNYPAKFSFNSSVANCGTATTPDYVVYSTGLAGTVTQASIVAFDNLYSGCTTGTVPSVYWAYNTSGTSSGKILTSPVISEDGKQIAFVQTDGVGAGTLVLLKWAASTIESPSAPGTPLSVLPSLYRACSPLPCMTTLALRNGSSVTTDDTTSSVFYDYKADIAWVGDSSGLVHQFTGIFKGTPAEVTTSPWPVQINAGAATTSAVFDNVSKQVFVGDATGFLYRIDSTTGTVTKSGQVDFGTGLVETPVLDESNELVYVFSSSDGTTNCTGLVACAAVFQFSATFTAGSTGSKVTVGNSVAAGPPPPNPMYIGGFDSTYLKSATPPTGNMYVCGNTGGNPSLYQIPITAGAFPAGGAANLITQLTLASTAACSPVGDILNEDLPGGTAERVFVSPQNKGLPTACSGKGCLISLLVTPWRPLIHWGLGQQILSPKLDIETVIVAGNAGATAPAWTTTPGDEVPDGHVTWLDQGHLTAVAAAAWQASQAYALGQRVIDTNNNIEIVITAGTSGTTEPHWPLVAGTITDNSVVWINAGNLPTAALSITGGTTGVIIDNTTNTTTGASQIYFGTLADQTCTTSGGSGVCAEQASQLALQ
jgi:hypothetical protein